jgi:hypothetical protein
MIETRAVLRCDRCGADMGEVTIGSADGSGEAAPIGATAFTMTVADKTVEFSDLCESCLERLKALQVQADKVSRPSRRRGSNDETKQTEVVTG